MTEHFDAVVLGAGPAGEVALNTLTKADCKIALVENELIGGECTNWGCIPSKTLLRPPDLKGQTSKAAGASTTRLDWPEAVRLPRLHGLEPRRLEADRALRGARRHRDQGPRRDRRPRPRRGQADAPSRRARSSSRPVRRP